MKTHTVESDAQQDWLWIITNLIFYVLEVLGGVAFIAMCIALWIITPEWPLPTQWWEFLK